jgi:hypothetical protein
MWLLYYILILIGSLLFLLVPYGIAVRLINDNFTHILAPGLRTGNILWNNNYCKRFIFLGCQKCKEEYKTSQANEGI